MTPKDDLISTLGRPSESRSSFGSRIGKHYAGGGNTKDAKDEPKVLIASSFVSKSLQITWTRRYEGRMLRNQHKKSKTRVEPPIYRGGKFAPLSSFAPSGALIAVDPGAEHCGLALFAGDHVDVSTHPPKRLIEIVEASLPATLVCEEWRTRALPALTGDPLRTVEVIGVLRFLAERSSSPFVLQSPTIKRPAAAMVRRRGIRLTGETEHARDAELHGWYYLLRKGTT